ncbi:MAG: transcription antitermination factor NusB [Candidatus Neomarinimicrobiota bacterium]|nr:transcription antitermination factor NusB [Candidatus Neomarinimicrobiota bacterium]
MINKDARYHAFQILLEFERNKNQLKLVRNRYYNSFSVSQNDINRSLVLSNEVVRWRRRLDYWIGKNLSKSLKSLNTKALIILRLGYYEILIDQTTPIYAAVNSWVQLSKYVLNNKFIGLINAVLRKSAFIDPTEKDLNQSIGSWYSYPDWLINSWIKKYDKKSTNKLCDWFNKPAHTDLRINTDYEKIEKYLSGLKIEFKLSPHSNHFIRIKSDLKKIISSDYFSAGKINVQGRGSGAIIELLDPKPNSVVLDVCAAPGTKSLYIFEKMKNQGQLYCSDIDSDRILMGKTRAETLKLPIEWSCKDASIDSFPYADYILIDAPCTGTGVIGKNVDIRWRRKAGNAKIMSFRQLKILQHMAKFLKAKGVIVYSTCSMEYEENWNVVESFLKLNNNFYLESGKNFVPNQWLNAEGCLESFPPRDKIDGMFAARIRKYD